MDGLIFQIAVGVFAGNVLFATMMWGARSLGRSEEKGEEKKEWHVFAAAMPPLLCAFILWTYS